ADLLVSGRGIVAVGVARHGGADAGYVEEGGFDAPEAAAGERGGPGGGVCFGSGVHGVSLVLLRKRDGLGWRGQGLRGECQGCESRERGDTRGEPSRARMPAGGAPRRKRERRGDGWHDVRDAWTFRKTTRGSAARRVVHAQCTWLQDARSGIMGPVAGARFRATPGNPRRMCFSGPSARHPGRKAFRETSGQGNEAVVVDGF